MEDKIVVFGAGATGRGHIGLLAWQAGYKIIFVDKDAELVSTLQKAGKYTVSLCGEKNRNIMVTDFKVHHSEDR